MKKVKEDISGIYFGIPTYKRVSEQLTLKFLKSIGVPSDKIILATQVKEEYEACKKLYGGDCNVIYRTAHNLSGNRNTIIEYLPVGSEVLILDDDTTGFEVNRQGGLSPLSGTHFLEIVGRMFYLTRKYGGKLWSVYPVRNPYFMEEKPIIKFNKAIISVHGLITSDLRYDEDQTVKEDFMFVCDNFARGLPTLRLDNVVAVAKHWTNDGGCKEQWVANDECLQRLLKKYPQYVKLNTKRKGEVLIKQNIKVGVFNRGLTKVELF